jgi:hypothetical protein
VKCPKGEIVGGEDASDSNWGEDDEALWNGDPDERDGKDEEGEGNVRSVEVESGNGYSKGVESVAKGVPMILELEGEWRGTLGLGIAMVTTDNLDD